MAIDVAIGPVEDPQMCPLSKKQPFKVEIQEYLR